MKISSYYIKILSFLISFCIVINAQHLSTSQQTINKTNKCLFIQNKGQWDPEVKYLAQIGGMNAWITNSGVVYDYYKITRINTDAKTFMMNNIERSDFERKNTSIEGNVVRMELVNSEKEIISVGDKPEEGYYNYFIGNDKSKWASFVPLYDNVEIKGIYKNIDVKYYYDNGMLRYDYKAKPGADLSQIKFKFEGQEGLSISSNGELVLKTSIGEVKNGKIYAYQIEGGAHKEVECKFEQKEDGTIGLNAGGYDESKELIIDPLVYSTFIGGNGFSGLGGYGDQGYSIAIDAGGNAYITGGSRSSNYPVTTGAYQDSLNGLQDVFVTKLNSTGSALIYSTFIGIGGAFDDEATSIVVDISGNTYITGYALPLYYPTTSGAYQPASSAGGTSVFVTKLNPTGSSLIYSALIGDGAGKSITIDTGGNAYITGTALSRFYPTTAGAYQTTLGSSYGNVFVTKLNSTGSALLYSTLIGGSGNANTNTGDQGNSITIDKNGNAYITGQASSSNYPTTSGVYQAVFGGGNYVAFVTKLNSNGSSLVYSTFIGGNNNYGNSIAIDTGRNAYITGYAYNYSNYPVTSGAYQDSSNGIQNIFVTKLNSTGSALVYSTFIGGSGNNYYNIGDKGYSIALDASGNAYITGQTYSSDFPTTSGAFQTNFGGNNAANAFITKLNSNGNVLLYSSYIGGSVYDVGYSIVIDTSGNAYITGATQSSNYPTTSGAFQTTIGDVTGVFVTKLRLSTETFVQPITSLVPNKFRLYQNYPNPFNPNTLISYDLPFSSNVKIEVYNILGGKVRELLNGQKNVGYYEINFNTTGLASGVYLYMIEAKSTDGKSEFRETKKMMLLK